MLGNILLHILHDDWCILSRCLHQTHHPHRICTAMWHWQSSVEVHMCYWRTSGNTDVQLCTNCCITYDWNVGTFTVLFVLWCNKDMLAEVICHVIPHLMLHNTFDSMIIPITNQPINQETSSINVFIHQSTATVYRFYQDTIHLDHMSKWLTS